MFVDHRPDRRRSHRARRSAALLALIAVTGAVAGCAAGPSAGARAGRLMTDSSAARPGEPAPSGEPAPASSSTVPVPSAVPAPADLVVVDYTTAPKGLPADPAPGSTAALTEGLRPTARIAVYDAPGGLPRAYLTPTISGVPLVMPIVDRRPGWVAVLVPSVNRTVGWLPGGGWTVEPLRDQIVVHRRSHELAWYRDGALRQSWTVTIGSSATPTPLGRTFVIARSRVSGAVYAGVDALALGSVPDDPSAVGTGLRGAHIGIHAWHRDDFGASRSNGCVRVPKATQQVLLIELAPGTPVVVLD